MSLLDKLIVLQLKGEGLQVSPRAKVLYINPRYKIGFYHNLDSVHSLVYCSAMMILCIHVITEIYEVILRLFNRFN